MKMYPQEYEKVFSDNTLIRKKCDLNKVSTLNSNPENVSAYVNLLKFTVDSFEESIFDNLVKYIWLVRRFCYDGKHRSKGGKNGFKLDKAFGVFCRAHVGVEHRLFTSSSGPFSKIHTYFNEFFPDFLENDPFEVKYAFPYRNNTLSHLILVYQMPERLELLAFSEEKGLGYAEFSDFVLNYTLCYNEENGETYSFIFSNMFQPYIRYLKKDTRPKNTKKHYYE